MCNSKQIKRKNVLFGAKIVDFRQSYYEILYVFLQKNGFNAKWTSQFFEKFKKTNRPILD